MVATKTLAVREKFRRSMTSIVNVAEEDDHREGSSDVDRLRQLLAARDSAAWNFDFQTSTPLPGRYDWRPSSAADVMDTAAPGVERERFALRRGGWLSTPRYGSARRRLVFDEQDSMTADTALTNFLLKRLVPPQMSSYPADIATDLCSPEVPAHGLCSLGSVMPVADVQVSSDDQRHRNNAAAIFRVRHSSSTKRRNVATKRSRSAYENSSLRVSKITGKHAILSRNSFVSGIS